MSVPIVALSLVAVIAVAVQTVNDYSEMVAAQRVVAETARRDADVLEGCQHPVPEECVRSEVCRVRGEPVVRLTASRTRSSALWTRWGTVEGTYLYELAGGDWAGFPWLAGTKPCATR